MIGMAPPPLPIPSIEELRAIAKMYGVYVWKSRGGWYYIVDDKEIMIECEVNRRYGSVSEFQTLYDHLTTIGAI